MRIVEIIPQLHIGGAENFVVNLCNEFVRQGHEVYLVVTNSIKKYGHLSEFLDHRIKLIPLEKRSGPDPILFFRLPLLISKLDPDVVHTHLGAILYTILCPITSHKKIKFYHTIHNEASKEATTGGRISETARKIQFKKGLVTPVTISTESQKSFVDFYGPECKSELIFNGVPEIKFNKENAMSEMSLGDIKLVNVARIQKQKNQIELVKAVHDLNISGETKKRVQLYIVGADDTEEADEIRKLNSPYTTLLGRKNNPRDYIANADAFVLSSNYEGLPLTLIECFSTGTIPICTPVGGIKDLIKDGENGILTKGTHKDEIKEAILRLINSDTEQRYALENASKESFQNLTMEMCASNYIRLFEN